MFVVVGRGIEGLEWSREMQADRGVVVPPGFDE